eukprot:7496898-Pyramimonas_sp.AAC.1
MQQVMPDSALEAPKNAAILIPSAIIGTQRTGSIYQRTGSIHQRTGSIHQRTKSIHQRPPIPP